MSYDQYPPLSPYSTGLSGRCPRCGEGKLFRNFITVADSCDHCGQDFAFADAGDGPAIFVMMIAGFIIVGVALWLEIEYEPPMWIYPIIFLPLTLVVCLGMLRPLKGVLISLQYANKAEQGRLKD
jgi:uncharacterized protein (DUF983 family)